MHPAESGISKRTASRKHTNGGRGSLGGRTLCITGLSNWMSRPRFNSVKRPWGRADTWAPTVLCETACRWTSHGFSLNTPN
ncbi:hypothetical protein SISNIDRAFT_450625 [Sistotremastrum niveocremeum HHB9708]|uniref:Uncharacterized protein n=1 Tax=Sistotremastrum niveocremeum HHB9708 TaxID=1314777 RepID=A0A164YFX7_9AGAM|nr:hypothetical protein SISNIDRAFT_450625 [Sistotremastrum niveocremeum HHB9708]